MVSRRDKTTVGGALSASASLKDAMRSVDNRLQCGGMYISPHVPVSPYEQRHDRDECWKEHDKHENIRERPMQVARADQLHVPGQIRSTAHTSRTLHPV